MGDRGPDVFIDANVLYSTLPREIALGLGRAGLIYPHWSTRVLDEWQIAAARRPGIKDEAAAQSRRTEMEEMFPDALKPPRTDLQATLILPDPSDAHVAAAAVGSDVLLTFNVKDFPRRAVATLGFEVRHPDSFYWALWSEHPQSVEAVVRAVLEAEGIAWDRRRTVLKRALLSRLGKALAVG